MTEPTQAAILECARILNCTPRQVQNRMSQMYEQLRQCAEALEPKPLILVSAND